MLSHRLSVFVLIVAGLTYYFCIHRAFEEIFVESLLGRLKGLKSYSRDGKAYNAFWGIPYGKSPVGELRFQPPVPSDKWEGTLDATGRPPLCLQYDPIWRKVLGQEDCLILNVFTPKLPSKISKKDTPLPVMVFIHGGFFMFGGTDLYDPSYFMDHDVVLVTIHYRLGAFGFLSTNDDVLSGNNGLKDQLLALKWVQSNIQHFGGDPQQVTIFGESAGGASVHYHMLSPHAGKLFVRAISQSGSGFVPYADPTNDAKSQALRLGKTLNCSTHSSTELAKCLRSKDGRIIAQTQEHFLDIFSTLEGTYGPTLERPDVISAFITKHPRQIYKEGNLAKIPWLTGANSEEGCWRSVPIFSNEGVAESFLKNWNDIILPMLFYPKPHTPQIAQEVFEFYFKDNPKFLTYENDYQALTNVFSDWQFIRGLGESVRSHVKHAPTFAYYLTHVSQEGLGLLMESVKRKLPPIVELGAAKLKLLLYTKILGWEVRNWGVCHADELQYLFVTFPTTDIRSSSPHYQFSKSMVSLWVSFAKNGYPSDFNGIKWEPVQPNKPPQYMQLGEPGGMIEEPFTARFKFWQDLSKY